MSSFLSTLQRAPAPTFQALKSLTTSKSSSSSAFPALLRPRRTQVSSTRCFTSSSTVRASQPDPAPAYKENSNSRIPLVVLGGVLAIVPLYYFLHSDKVAASEQAKIQDARRKHGTKNETRDPRDSEVKTLEQKRIRDGK